jgi:hypothetical protein
LVGDVLLTGQYCNLGLVFRTEMECSVGRVVPEPLELTVSAVAVVARGPAPPGSELAQEATP